jgi:hypothetical protein
LVSLKQKKTAKQLLILTPLLKAVSQAGLGNVMGTSVKENIFALEE